jgi:AraC family transcriptional regulator of arabinose operon
MARATLIQVITAGQIRLTTRIGIVRCEPVWELKPYTLVDHLLWCVLDGVGAASISGRSIALGPGTCLLLPPGTALSATHDPKRRLRVLYLHADFLDEAGQTLTARTFAGPPIPTVVNDLELFAPLARNLVECAATKTPAAEMQRDLVLKILLLKLHEAASAPVTRSDATKLAAALQAVRESPGQAWDVPHIAAAAGLSVSQAARRIRALTGLSPRDYVIRARVERARRLMTESNFTLEQIASTLGYADVYFFHRQFKAIVGITPGRWRREIGAARSHSES